MSNSILPNFNKEWFEKKLTFGFMGGKSTGPQSKADIAAGGFRPSGSIQPRKQVNAANPHSAAATPQGRRAAVTSQQTADRKTFKRAEAANKRRSGERSLMTEREKRRSDTLG
jgi:hypothetical protein